MTATKTCSIDGCDRKFKGRGMCATHIWREKHHGSPHAEVETRTYSVEESLAAHTERRGDCLIWTGYRDKKGYGRMRTNGKLKYTHRAAWEAKHGPISEGMMIDHRYHCDPACCEVTHLRLATREQNGANRAGPARNNRSGHRNIRRRRNRWMVQVKSHGVVYGHSHPSLEEAIAERDALSVEHHGDFAGSHVRPKKTAD